MRRHVVIGTAGHVDHGKTALVRALTGVDTDRWEEEKRRGITIDLGFAAMPLAADLDASIVDVPGHEDFVRNMVAGATGIDVALLVIAADEGMMPQTEEHLAILEFVGVRTGIVVVTKSDIAEPDWLDLVLADVGERVSASSIAWQPPVAVSAVSGQGLEGLTTMLATVGRQAASRSSDDLFRLPIDRSFSVAGAGTVVTGTTWSGSVSTGDTVRILPGDMRARVRSVEVHGEQRDAAEPGRRTALALPNIARDDVVRGVVVVTDDTWHATSTLDALVTLLPGAKPLTQRSRIRVHLGTAEVFARITPQDGDIAPGEEGAVRLRLEAPLVARWGDRGVLRSYSPVTTIGGCVVVDPNPPRRPRRPQRLEDRSGPDAAGRVCEFVELAATAGVGRADLKVRCGVHPRDVDAIVEKATENGVVEIDRRLYADAVIQRGKSAALEAIDGYHTAHPLEPGMPRGLLRAAIEPAAIADAVQVALDSEGKIAIEAETVRLMPFTAALSGAQRAAAAALRTALKESANEGKTARELDDVVPGARDIAEFLVRAGEAMRIGADRYFDASALEKLKSDVINEIRKRDGIGTPAQLRERTGLSRKFLIPVLEWLDGEGLTVRDGDGRRLGPKA